MVSSVHVYSHAYASAEHWDVSGTVFHSAARQSCDVTCALAVLKWVAGALPQNITYLGPFGAFYIANIERTKSASSVCRVL